MQQGGGGVSRQCDQLLQFYTHMQERDGLKGLKLYIYMAFALSFVWSSGIIVSNVTCSPNYRPPPLVT